MKELMYIRSFSKRHLSVIMGTLLLVIIGSVWLNTAPFRSGFEITDELGGRTGNPARLERCLYSIFRRKDQAFRNICK